MHRGPVRTFGLTHIALGVTDVERARRFYADVFGMIAVYAEAGFVQLQTPGARDVLVLEKTDAGNGTTGGVRHFGFRLVDPADIDTAAAAIAAAGGTITDKGEFVPGEPYVFFRDPDGYEVEVWFEIPTKVDPAS
jgi:catechol 2,3-dioxygenase-like lactoylglutathione lyase family enzyme